MEQLGFVKAGLFFTVVGTRGRKFEEIAAGSVVGFHHEFEIHLQQRGYAGISQMDSQNAISFEVPGPILKLIYNRHKIVNTTGIIL